MSHPRINIIASLEDEAARILYELDWLSDTPKKGRDEEVCAAVEEAMGRIYKGEESVHPDLKNTLDAGAVEVRANSQRAGFSIRFSLRMLTRMTSHARYEVISDEVEHRLTCLANLNEDGSAPCVK